MVAPGPAHLRVARCEGCSFLFTLPRPHEDDLRKVFLDYDPPEEERVRAHIGARQPVYAEGLARIARYKREGRLLDVGSSFGAFLRTAKEAGWEAVGIEPSRPAAESARRSGLEVFCGFLEENPFPAGSFDVVTFWDVLEHLLDPRQEIREAHRLLKPDGLLVIRVPSGIFQLMKSRIPGGSFYIGSHLNHFSSRTLNRMLQEEGFRVEAIEAGAPDLQRGPMHGLLKRGYVALSRMLSRIAGPDIANILVAFATKRSGGGAISPP